ncbi:uncharacterized protein LOC130663815 [Microplitis mediator]|uniref:uncharacterized protein LOC130663815 n=1 Tax=Microplitis mediator TaxID=375433 RepID=UPI002552CC67|nr:uncharacterized protein LOC130663815 [Microplitis mediator]
MKANTFLVLLSLGLLCSAIPQLKGNDSRIRRIIDGTTTAEPKIGLNNSTLMSSNASLSTTMSIKTAQNSETTTSGTHNRETSTASSKTTTQSIDKLQYERYTTMNQNHHTSTTTAMPISPDASSSSVCSPASRHFDFLSFLGGSIFGFLVVGLGVLAWGLYRLHVERSYRTI